MTDPDTIPIEPVRTLTIGSGLARWIADYLGSSTRTFLNEEDRENAAAIVAVLRQNEPTNELPTPEPAECTGNAANLVTKLDDHREHEGTARPLAVVLYIDGVGQTAIDVHQVPRRSELWKAADGQTYRLGQPMWGPSMRVAYISAWPHTPVETPEGPF